MTHPTLDWNAHSPSNLREITAAAAAAAIITHLQQIPEMHMVAWLELSNDIHQILG